MNQKTIGAQLYTLRNYMQSAEGIESSLRKVKQIGYDAVQVSGIGQIAPDRLKAMTDELDLRICATHVGFDKLQSELSSVIETHKLWNCDYVGIGSMPKEYQTDSDGYQAFIHEISKIGNRLEEHGLHLVYHNHNFEFEKFDGTTGMQLLLEGAGQDTYTLEIDTYWVQAGGGNPFEWLDKAKGRIKVVHLKDMAVQGQKQVFAEIGQGNLNWHAIIDACRTSGVEWYIVEQDVCQRDEFDSLAMSLAYLKELV